MKTAEQYVQESMERAQKRCDDFIRKFHKEQKNIDDLFDAMMRGEISNEELCKKLENGEYREQ